MTTHKKFIKMVVIKFSENALLEYGLVIRAYIVVHNSFIVEQFHQYVKIFTVKGMSGYGRMSFYVNHSINVK